MNVRFRLRRQPTAEGFRGSVAACHRARDCALQDRSAWPDLDRGDAPRVQHQEPITVPATQYPILFRQCRHDMVDDDVRTSRVPLVVRDIHVFAAREADT